MLDVTALRTDDPEQVAGYRIVRRLGQGGQGVVFLGVGAGGEQVAIKRLRLEDERSRRQFAKEVGAARRVAAFCTARVITFDLEGESPFVVSEFIEGPSLQQLVRESGPLSGSRLHRLAIGTVTALAAIHQAGVVHRDLKPANVMVSADGPRVIDFGIARDMSNETTITSRVFGTPAYMAPEQIRAERVSPQTDMFAWASVMAFAATGRAPFDAKHMMAVVHRITTMEPDLGGVPPALAEVLVPCLNKDATRRPTAQQTLAMLLGRPAPVHDAEDPTVVLAEGSRLARAATGDPAGSDSGVETGQTVVTAQDVQVGPVGLGPVGGKRPVSVGQQSLARSAPPAGGSGAGQIAPGQAADGGRVASGPAAKVQGSDPVPAAGGSPVVETGSGAGISGAVASPAARVSGAASGALSAAANAQAAGLGPADSERVADGEIAGLGRTASDRGVNAQAAKVDGAATAQTASTRGPIQGAASAPARSGAAEPVGAARVVDPVQTGWSGAISQDAETIPTPVPQPPAKPGPLGSEGSVLGEPLGREAGDRAPAADAMGGREKEPEFGTPEPLVPAPGGPSDPITPVRRKRLAGLGSGVGAVLLVLLLGGGMVAGGATALRALLHRGSPGTGSQGGQNGGSIEPSPSSSTPSPAASPAGAVLPDWATGEWSGEVDQPTGKVTSYEVQISLQASAAQGQIEIPELGCAGALTVESTTQSKVVMTTRLEDDAWGQCVDQSTVQLTRDGSGQLAYAWKDETQAGNEAGGTVTRQ